LTLAVAALLAIAGVGSCADSTSPVAPGDLVIVGGGAMTNIAAVSVSRGEVVARIGPIPKYKDTYALSPDSSRLYISSFDNSSPVTLTVVDTRSLRVVAQEPMSAIGARSAIGPVLPLGGYGMAVSPDGKKLVMNGLRGDSTTWLTDSARVVVIVDVASLTPVGLVGPFSVPADGIVPVPGSGESASQRVMVLGARPGASVLPSGLILILGGPDLTLVDSLKPGVPVYQVVPVSGGQAALLLSARSIYRFDLTTRELVASAPRPTIFGSPCLSPDGSRLYHTDPGDGFDFPGGGSIQVYDVHDETLQLLAPIDLGSADLFPPRLNNCAVSRDGRFLFVSSGTWEAGPLYPVQPGRLFVVDRSSGHLVRTVNMGDWLSREVFAF